MSAADGFGDDLAFLERHTETATLCEPGGPGRLALCPGLQGRVATTTTGGADGASFGWINRELIASGRHVPHMNVYGGEDRFWLGPEGGPFSLFFAPGAPQDLAHWQTPAPIDSEPFSLAERESDRALLRKSMRLTNAAGAVFQLEVEREIAIFPARRVWNEAGVPPASGVSVVGFASRNRVTNRGPLPWRRETGLPSIWIAGTFPPSPSTVIAVPFRGAAADGRGPIVNDRYFGPVPPARLAVRRSTVLFRGDGQERGKIGIPAARARAALGSYAPERHLLTIVTFSLPEDARGYVNSLWGPQADPYAGDVVNGYNDGPAAPGAKPFGPFYELETSSPALPLAPGEAAEHIHRTLHFLGTPEALDRIARSALGVAIEDVTSAGAF